MTSLADYVTSAPKKKAKKKVAKKVVEKKPEMKIEKVNIPTPIAPIIKIIEQPNYSPMVEKQATMNGILAEQAIASMRDSVNNNQAVMTEVIRQISVKPKEFLIVRDGKGDMNKIIPVYDDGR